MLSHSGQSYVFSKTISYIFCIFSPNFFRLMLAKIKQQLNTIPDWQQKKYLLAFSGGLDSVVLAHLLKNTGVNFALAHCNFKLRGKESDEDQNFVANFARQNQIPFFTKICDLSRQKENIQLAARHVRYAWFDELLQKQAFDYLLTAHHLNDSMETFFINLLRGTGLKGLTGIKNEGKILRPMQHISREEIKRFARQNNLHWREDSSNASDKYRRNYIRHHIIPQFKEINPQFEKTFLTALQLLQQSQAVEDTWFEATKKHLISQEADAEILNLNRFRKMSNGELFLYRWLSAYGFSDWQAVSHLTQAQTGKILYAAGYRLSKHGDSLILEPVSEPDTAQYFIDIQADGKITSPLSLSWKIYARAELEPGLYVNAAAHEAYVDFDKLEKNLLLRKWQAGDFFYPLGMKGKKKLSDYFKDEKLRLSEKEKIWLICSAENIVWIAGKRVDNRYKITDATQRIIHMKLNNE